MKYINWKVNLKISLKSPDEIEYQTRRSLRILQKKNLHPIWSTITKNKDTTELIRENESLEQSGNEVIIQATKPSIWPNVMN